MKVGDILINKTFPEAKRKVIHVADGYYFFVYPNNPKEVYDSRNFDDFNDWEICTHNKK